MSILASLGRIDRCASSTLAHQRKHNAIDIGLVLQRVDYKCNRDKEGSLKKGWNKKDAFDNINSAMGYLNLKHGYPTLSDSTIYDFMCATQVHVHMSKVWYNELDYCSETNQVVRVKKWRPIWEVSKEDCKGVSHVLKKFKDDSDLVKWLEQKYKYVPRIDSDIQVDIYE